MMKEKRNNARYPASAQIWVSENRNITLFLKNISITGCSITNSLGGLEPDTADPVADGTYPEANGGYKISIFPETESGVPSFEMIVELCWSRIQDTVYEAGGLISGYPEKRQYQAFADYLAWRTTHT
jgi:hypothetical protein